MLAVDQYQQPSHIDGEAHTPLDEFPGAQFCLDVDFVQVHFFIAVGPPRLMTPASLAHHTAGGRCPSTVRYQVPYECSDRDSSVDSVQGRATEGPRGPAL